MINGFQLYDLVEMKKPHACGSNNWKIIRTGADIKIKCLTCSRIVMMERDSFQKHAKRITGHSEEQIKDEL